MGPTPVLDGYSVNMIYALNINLMQFCFVERIHQYRYCVTLHPSQVLLLPCYRYIRAYVMSDVSN